MMSDEHVKVGIIGHGTAGRSALAAAHLAEIQVAVAISGPTDPIRGRTYNFIIYDEAPKAETTCYPLPLKADYKLKPYELDHCSSNFIGVDKKATAKRRAKKKAARKQRRKTNG
jgi:hypothetical protein